MLQLRLFLARNLSLWITHKKCILKSSGEKYYAFNDDCWGWWSDRSSSLKIEYPSMIMDIVQEKKNIMQRNRRTMILSKMRMRWHPDSLAASIFRGPVYFKVRKNFQDSLSHWIISHIHGALNINENKNWLHSLTVICEMNLLSLVTP